MRKILMILFLLVGFVSYGQVKQNYNQYGGRWLRSDDSLATRLPRKAVGVKDFNAGFDTAQIYYNPADSTIKYYTGFQWITLAAGSSGIFAGDTVNRWVGSVYRRSDSVFFKTGSTEYFAFKDNTGSGGDGIAELGNIDNYGLLRPDDSTYAVDTSLISTKWYATNNFSDGDTTVFETVIDSTAQPGQRVLFSGGNNKIRSDSYFLYDSVNNKLMINHFNISAGGPNTKLFVNGNSTIAGAATINSGIINNTPTTSAGSFDILTRNTSGGVVEKVASTYFINSTDTTNKWVGNIWRVPGIDSIYFRIGAVTYAVKDSTGGGGTNIYNTDGTLTGTRTLSLNTLALNIQQSSILRNSFAPSGFTSYYDNGTRVGALTIAPGSGLMRSYATDEMGLSSSVQTIDSLILRGVHSGFGRESKIIVKDSAIRFWSTMGNYYFPDIPAGVGTKSVRVDPSTGKISYADTTTGGSGTDLSSLDTLPDPKWRVVQNAAGTTYKSTAPKVYYAEDFPGVIPNDGLDDWAGLDSALKFVHAAGGGDLILPLGKLHTSRVIKFPLDSYEAGNDSMRSIRLIGQASPNMYSNPLSGSALSLYGSLIEGTFLGDSAVIDTYSSSGGWGDFNFLDITIENIGIYVRSMTGATDVAAEGQGINAQNMAMVKIKNVFISTTSSIFASVQPASTSIGIVFPAVNNFVVASANNITITGFYYASMLFEHASIDNYFADACYYGIFFNAGNHSSHVNKAVIARCKITVGTGGGARFGLDNLSIEDKIAGGFWWQNTLDLEAHANSSGYINYQRVETELGGPDNDEFRRTDGPYNITCLPLGENVPQWATDNRPDILPQAATVMGYNTDSSYVEVYNHATSSWMPVNGVPDVENYCDHDLGINLLAYYDFEESTGNFLDKSGNGKDLTRFNSAATISGKVSNAVGLTESSSQYVKTSVGSGLSAGTGFTFTAWVMLHNTAPLYQHVVQKGATGTFNFEYNIVQYAGNIYWQMSTDGAGSGLVSVSKPFLRDSLWHFVVGKWDGANISLSIDNGSAATAAMGSAFTASTTPLYLGSDATPAWYLSGGIDEVGIWNTDLSAGEITALYNSGTGRTIGSEGGGILFAGADCGIDHDLLLHWDNTNKRLGVGTNVPDSTLHVVGGLKFVTGRQGAGKVLTSNASGGADWETASGGATTLSALTDVNISSPSNKQLLQFQTGDNKWHNYTLIAGDIPDLSATYEVLANKSTNTSLGSSNTLYPTQNAVKTYVDNTAATITPKAAVVAATTGAGTLASSFENGDAIDGITLATNDRILIKNQAAEEENGIYTVNASGAPTRATDFDAAAEIPVGAETFVQSGTANSGKKFTQTEIVTTLNTDPINFVQTGGASGVAWGAITGTLSDQSDLQSALDLKANLASPTFTGTVILPNSTVTNAMLAGSIDLTTKVTGILPAANGGTGVDNSTRTLTINTNGGTIAFPGASTTMTFPSTSATIARTDAANTFTGVQTLSSAPVLSTGTVTVSGNAITFPTVASTITAYKETNTASSGTWTPAGDARENFYDVTAQSGNVTAISAPSGTPANHNTLIIRVKDNGTARTISGWDAIYRVSSDLALPTTTVLSKTMYMKFIYNSADSKWDFISFINNF